MAHLKVPVALWQDTNGNWTACAIDGASVSAIGSDAKDAKQQLKKYLEWHYRKSPWQAVVDFSDPVVADEQVDLRARHETEEGNFPAENVVNARFRYIWGKRSDGSLVCYLPTLDTRFYCRKESQLKALVKDQIVRLFADATSAAIADALFAPTLETDSIGVTFSGKESARQEKYPLESLPEVAVALGDRHNRKQFSPAWGRSVQVKWLTDQMLDSRRSILLVGEAGVGKTTILAESVRQAQSKIRKQASEDPNNTIPPNTQRFWMTNASRLIAGMQYLGQWEQRCESVIDELSEIQGVLCIENLLALLRTGSHEPTSSVAAFMRHFMLNGELRLIGEATPAELETIRRLLPGFDSLFSVLQVPEMRRGSAIKVLNSIADHFQKMQRIDVDSPAIGLTFQLFKRFLPYDPFPGKCAVFWRRLFERRVDKLLKQPTDVAKERTIDVDDVISAFVADTGLPEFLVRDEILLQSEEVQNHFDQKIIGQPVACQAVTDMVMTFKAAMNDPNRPIGVYFFCGPTGVGKTELAKTLSRYLFGAGEESPNEEKIDRMIRVDMSEYSIPGSSERLLTRPDGRPSELIEKIRRQPFVVLLLDEIEKANFEVFDTLMNVFDEGRLTDRMGRVTSFCSTVIIMTSNLGTSTNDPIGFDDDRAQGYEKEVRKFFRPEFFNRLDSVVTFNHLSAANIQAIANKEIHDLREREGLDRRHIRIDVHPDVTAFVAKRGYDRKLGARPLQRVIEQHVVTPLARWIAENPTAQSITLTLAVDDDQVTCQSSAE